MWERESEKRGREGVLKKEPWERRGERGRQKVAAGKIVLQSLLSFSSSKENSNYFIKET